MQSAFTKLQDAVVARLRRRSDMQGVTILARRNGIAAIVKESIAKNGLCVLVMPPRPKDATITETTPVFKVVVCCVRVIENAFFTHAKDAMSVSEVVSRSLHAWQPTVAGIASPLILDNDDAWDLDDEPDKNGRYTIEIKFTTTASV
jgi:hypothetical protein